MSRNRARPIALLLAAALCLGGAGTEPGEDDECLLEVAVYRYLTAAQDRILARWELPPDGMANREVVLRLVFERDGSLRDSRILSYTDRRLARSAKIAILKAKPFPPVPEEAACLVGRPIRTTLHNPAD
ncbi:MAG: TonB C-terminal domain-containing protein [Myxococcota bacterium]|nr:TonB C-terminal domain-containing protein [Myxococcota bacterium]